VGKIAIFDFQAYVAVERGVAKALQRLNDGKIKAVRCACASCKNTAFPVGASLLAILSPW
jgi:hypothetical protein